MEIRDLIIKWTQKSQSSAYSDMERAVYTECAMELYELIQKKRIEEMSCSYGCLGYFESECEDCTDRSRYRNS